MKLTAADIRRLMTYDSETGVFRWRIGRPKASAGKVAGTIVSLGRSTSKREYVAIGVNHTRYLAHRLAFLYVTGDWPPDLVDHINGNSLDNRWNNLRAATQSENNKNNHMQRSDNKTGVRGVCFDKSRGKFRAEITLSGKNISLGRFATLAEAAEVVRSARLKHYGEFASAADRR